MNKAGLHASQIKREDFVVLRLEPTNILVGEKVFGQERAGLCSGELLGIKGRWDIRGGFKEDRLTGGNKPFLKVFQHVLFVFLDASDKLALDSSDEVPIARLDGGRVANIERRHVDAELSAVAANRSDAVVGTAVAVMIHQDFGQDVADLGRVRGRGCHVRVTMCVRCVMCGRRKRSSGLRVKLAIATKELKKRGADPKDDQNKVGRCWYMQTMNSKKHCCHFCTQGTRRGRVSNQRCASWSLLCGRSLVLPSP